MSMRKRRKRFATAGRILCWRDDDESIPVILCDGWTDAQIRAFRLVVNRSVTWAEWDMERLSAELTALEAAHFDLNLTGFDTAELQRLLGSTTGIDPDAIVEPDPVA